MRRPAEPLSCDYRKTSHGKTNFRYVHRIELPRLAAVLLRCSYDELIQREHQYRKRRAAAVLLLTASLAGVSIVYLSWSNLQIKSNLLQAQASTDTRKSSLDCFPTIRRRTWSEN